MWNFGRKKENRISALTERAEKYAEFYRILARWIAIHQDGRNLSHYFKKNRYSSVAVYGMKDLGQMLVKELDGTGITVAYTIDKNADSIYQPIDIFRPDEKLPTTDVVIVTAVHYFEEIERDLFGKVDCPVISLMDVMADA